MLKENAKVTIHFINNWMFKTPKEKNIEELHNVVFDVVKVDNKLGVYYPENSGPNFTPFRNFANTVFFKNVENGELYRFSNIIDDLENVTELDNKIAWLR